MNNTFAVIIAKGHRYAVILMVALIFFNITFSQRLNVGDTIPQQLWDHSFEVTNHTRETFQLNSVKGKSIILDFWGTTCVPCIRKIPEIGRFTQIFSDRLAVVAASHENKEQIDKFITKYRLQDKNRYFPVSIVDNKLLRQQLLPYQSIPHYVWIDHRGVIRAITYDRAITEENVRKFVNGESFDYELKNDITDFDYGKPVFIHENGGPHQPIMYRSLLTGPIPGMGMARSAFTNPDAVITMVRGINNTIEDLFKIPYAKELRQFHSSRIILDVERPGLLRFNAHDSTYEQWRKVNTYTYELNLPPTIVAKAKTMVIEDLKRYFGLRGYFEEREIACRVLTANKNINRSYTKGGEPKHNGNFMDEDLYFINQPSKLFISFLMVRQLSEFYINEINCDKNLDIYLPANLKDHDAVAKKLKEQGIDVTIEMRKMQVFVITDK